ncbi:MAG: VOC family protein [Actinobacteria bacterium]|nr:VOC family protein [Actinomycetota bacterium]MDQ3533952.1 VOC family protein [Actinomycetota bacterium]
MPDRDGYPPGVPCWVDTTQSDPDSAADFYGGLFGWELEDATPTGSDVKYVMARMRGRDVAAISSPFQGAPSMAVWNTYVWVDSADEAATKVRDAGGQVVMEPFDVMEAGRVAVFADPEGAVFSVWQAKESKGAQVVNEHGSVNFNSLNTREVEGAKAFYGAVFGWETLELGPGNAMWRLPGYGDHLEEMNPGLREGMAEMNAPPGFEDVVAALTRIADDQPDVPPHWSVTFAVDDADATAERAAKLGAELVVPPMDAPWVRMMVIRDPQGATFVASQFVAENSDLGG